MDRISRIEATMNTERIASERAKRKEDFYKIFELLEQSDDDNADAFNPPRSSLEVSGKPSKATSAASRDSNKRTHDDGDNDDTTSTAKRQLLERTSSQHVATRKPPGLPSSREPPSSAIPRSKDKGKGLYVVKQVPEERRLFRDMHFFFFPNNDANNARRLRIIKALEYGASWQKDWNSFITHVIMDKSLRYGSLLDFLKVPTIPENITVVNETWPAECLMFQTIQRSDRVMFAVPDAPARVERAVVNNTPAVVEATASQPSDTSLKLKPAGKAVRAREPTTPTTDDNESQHNTTNVPRVTEHKSGVVIQDSLQDMPEDFKAAVGQARDLNGVPLDDEDTDSQPIEIRKDTNDAGIEEAKGLSKHLTYADKFQCMQAHTGQNSEGPNSEVVKILQQMADHYTQISDEWRSRSYRKAIATIRNHPIKITTKEQAQAIPNVGDRLASKIEEIVTTHRLRRLDNAQAEPADQTLQLFLKIYDVGYVQARNWVQSGYRSLQDLLTKAKLSTNQRIGIEHFEDFNLRIPRDQVKQHGETVERALQRLDSGFTLVIGGSYRRGSPDSSDIDCVITHPSYDLDRMRTLLLDKLIPTLMNQGFLVAELAAMSAQDGTKWLGASCLPGTKVWRRMDFLLVPAEELGAAMIYFTGNDIFNRSMRLLASKKGLRLNQKGLWKDVIRGRNREKTTQGTLLEGRDEQRIFQILGVPWREPHERII